MAAAVLRSENRLHRLADAAAVSGAWLRSGHRRRLFGGSPCVVPQGAKIVYKHVVAPYMDKYEQDIDNLVESTKTRADSAFKHMRHHSAQIIAAQSSRLLKMGSQLIASAAAEAGRPAPAAGPGGAGVPGTVEEEKKEQ